MRYILTNYGHRYLQHVAARDDAPEADDVRVLRRVLARGALSDDGSDELRALAAKKLVEPLPPALEGADEEAIQRRYDRNPLEHLRRVVFEYTTVCNLDCLHCRNHNLEAHAEADPAALRRVVDAALPIGLDRFDFIGGEVTLYGKGWLDLVGYIRAEGGEQVQVITSGWFLGETGFLAAGRRYADDRAYLEDLRARGVTHVVYSIDGPEEVHDRCRQVPGLYRRVLDGLEKTRAAGLAPRVSLVIGLSDGTGVAWLADLAQRIYGASTSPEQVVRRLVADESNYVSNFIDVGGGIALRRSRADLDRWSDDTLRCKNFFRPSPTLRIKATGEISLCPLVEGGDGYGNVHERDIVDLLNHLQDALVYKIHAEKRLGEYRRLLDADVFGGRIAHPCSVRVAINMVAMAAHERGVGPDDREALRAINVEVAEKMGVLPRALKNRANGHARAR